MRSGIVRVIALILATSFLAKLYGSMFDEIWLASAVEMEFRQLGI